MENIENVNVSAVDAVETTDERNPIKRDFIPHRRVSIRICKEKNCGKVYLLSDNDAVHYITKYGSLPLRCEECRKRIREANPYNTTETSEDNAE